MKAWWRYVPFLLAPLAVARADVAPPVVPLAHPIVPREAYRVPSARRLTLEPTIPLADAPVDVGLQAGHVTLEVWPTVVMVRASFDLVGGASGAHGLRIGFPERTAGAEGAPVLDLAVRVDGQPRHATLELVEGDGTVHPPRERRPVVAPPAVDRAPAALEDLLARAGDDPVRWWVWTVDVPPGRRVRVEASYGQAMLFIRQDGTDVIGSAGVVLRPAALWRGPVGRATRVERHLCVPGAHVAGRGRAVVLLDPVDATR